MYIKSLVIDGFKSYGKRVELNGFDPEFNAITGLNGTGKSNILDAICFALGISSMHTIRSTSMQDVIYKSGQAGVHTATVTITFDNRDKSRSAPYYNDIDEIVISREVGMGSKNTYRINGVIVQAKKIMDFFNSLQMNVNNPHFIIMQGRITKVLNMNPIDVLLMIEEAAGTNMYESKKKKMELTVSRKESKLKEIRDTANEEIIPTMESIEKEKGMLEELNMVQCQLRNQSEKFEYYKYVKSKETLKILNDDIQAMDDRKHSKNNDTLSLQDKIKIMKTDLQEYEKKMKKEDVYKLSIYKNEVEEIEKNKCNVQLKVNACKSNINCEEKKINNLQKQINISKKILDAIQEEMNDFNEMNAGFDEENNKNALDLEEIDKKIRMLNSGNIFTDEDNGSVQENINKFNYELQNQQTENHQYKIKIDALKTKLSQHLSGMKEAQKEYDIQMTQLVAKEKEFEKINNKYLKANEELKNHNSLRSNRDSFLKEIHELNSKIQSFELTNSHLFFKYKDPYPNFDRNKVHGLVCRLFKPIDFRFELALTTLAGGKLYFIVVEDDTIGKDILETNEFPYRKNFIPLNQIKANSLSQNVVQIAQKIGGADKVFPAMSLIEYDKKHLKAIQWIFGQAFICTTKEVAEKVCFDNRVNKNCFTLEGDHFNPSGNITGGANTQKMVLEEISKQNEIISHLQVIKSEFQQLDNKFAAMANLPDTVIQLRDEQLTVQEELEKVKSNVQLGKPYQQVTEVNSITQQIADLEEKLMEGKANEKKLQIKIKELEIKMKNVKNILKQQFSDCEKARKNILQKINNNKSEYDKKKNDHNILELKIKSLKNQILEEEQQLAELNFEKNKFDNELSVCMSELDEINNNYIEKSKEYNIQKEEVTKKYKRIEELNDNIKAMVADIESNKIQLLELDGEKKKKISLREAVKETYNHLNEKLSTDQKEMAQKTDYTNFDSGECQELINKLQDRYDQLSKVVDPGKLNNFHKHIQEYKSLQKKLDTVEKDKQKILQIIHKLEIKKRSHLKSASDRVNLEFGKIFSSVLPGAQACLRQIDNDDITAGLEIRVAFNGLWKESLDELSGGQRSLVALSLVLAMLLFNPVPLYILDEIDAALDLSHTQNIGKMLKEHFKQSQFIVVSLKDGMFSNSNVLFTTKFVDGSSAVTRTTCKQT